MDENLPGSVAVAAGERGHEAVWVRDAMPGAPDVAILTRIRSTGEMLVTRDVRFANHVLEQIVAGAPLTGVILIREQSLRDLMLAWSRFLESPRFPRGIAVVTARGVRYREAPDADAGR